jgi:hypothetical protein
MIEHSGLKIRMAEQSDGDIIMREDEGLAFTVTCLKKGIV